MSIQITTLKGTNSISADRITINDNFKINTDAINNILSIVDTTTGKIDNTGVGADNTITTEGITLTASGVDVQVGDIDVQAGDLKLLHDGAFIEMGTNNSQIVHATVTGATAATKNIVQFVEFSGIEIPKVTTVDRVAIGTDIGATGPNVVVFDTDTGKFTGWTGSQWVNFH